MTAPPATAVALELDPDGGVIVVKRPSSEDGIDQIRAEARILEAARHPGVVDLVASTDSAGGPAVVTRWIGATTLAGAAPLPLTQAAGVMAALADVVADLHELGITHGAITADHVIFSPSGRPVLCGFGSARLVASDGDGAKMAMEDDVAALGLLLSTVAGDEVDIEPIPERRGWRRRPRWQGYQRRALLMLADQATTDDPRIRPSARAFAAAIHDTIPDAKLAPVAEPPEIPPGVLAAGAEQEAPAVAAAPPTVRIGEGHFASETPTGATIGGAGSPIDDLGRLSEVRFPPRRVAAAVVGLFGVAMLLYGLIELRSTGPGTGDRAAPTTPHVSPAPSTPSTVRVAPATAPARPITSQVVGATSRPLSRCRRAVPDGPDLDADGCPDAVRVSGDIVQAAGVRYGVGRTGDQVVVGDWRCDGRATPAVLRPSTGEVFVFARWATRRQQVTITPTTRVHGASLIRATDVDHDGCSELQVRTVSGNEVLVNVRSEP